MSEHVKSDIPFYINGDLPDSRRQQVESHLEQCASCRQALNKAKNKVSRQKRQALKGAGMPDRVPNLLVTRLGRQIGVAQKPSQTPWGWIIFLFIALGAGAWIARKHLTNGLPLAGTAENPLPVSTSAAAAFDVEHSSPSSLRTDGSLGAAAVQTPLWSGQESAVKETRLVVVRGGPAWRALWAEMGQTDAAPRVNFGEHAVVGVFAGERPAGSYQITFGPPQEDEKAVTVPYAITPSSAASAGTAPVHPYGLITVPATPKRIHFTQQPT